MIHRIRLIFLIVFVLTNTGYAQNINLGSDNYIFLHSAGDVNWRFGKDNEHNVNILGYGSENRRFRIVNSFNNSELFNVNFSNGNVGIGIGINSPVERLQVNGNMFLNQHNPTLFWSGNSLNLTSKDNCIPVVCLRGTASYNPRFDMYKAVSGERTIVLDAGSDCFFNSGNVGIGTTDPKNLLDVNGTIHAREVKVDLTGWSDFVFHPSYQLKPLTEVEKFIKANGHLHDIPSAAEVEQNGVNVGEMQKKLLQKVEELTLYVIELKKENEQLKEDKSIQLQMFLDLKKEIEKMKTSKL